MMSISDLNGQTIQITDLQQALLQADDYRHFQHESQDWEYLLRWYTYQKLLLKIVVRLKESQPRLDSTTDVKFQLNSEW